MDNFKTVHCKACEAGVAPMTTAEIERALGEIPGWEFNQKENTITRCFNFKGFNKTMSFANAVAWIANREGHHPTLEIGYDYCKIHFSTHAIKAAI